MSRSWTQYRSERYTGRRINASLEICQVTYIIICKGVYFLEFYSQRLRVAQESCKIINRFATYAIGQMQILYLSTRSTMYWNISAKELLLEWSII